MEDFYPDGKIKYIKAVDYKKEQKPISQQSKEAVLRYMENSDNYRVILTRLDNFVKLVTDGVYRWQSDTPDEIRAGKCQPLDEFVDHILEQYEEK